MEKPGKITIWMAQVRGPFLILAALLVGIGLALAHRLPGTADNGFNVFHAVLLVIGVVSSHVSVNLFNEYSDNKSKIDLNTNRTPFSGGSGMMAQGFTTPRQVMRGAIIALVISSSIGIYFAITSHWFIALIALIGGVTIISYTEALAKIQLGELFSGLTLGSLVVIGSYIAMTATPGMPVSELMPLKVVLLSIPPGILTCLLLLINEFPDLEADKEGGRNHLVISLGRKKAGYIYAFGIFLTFGTIFILPLLNMASPWLWLALIPFPLGIKSSVTAINNGDDLSKMIPALGGNVITVLATDLLLTIGILISPLV